MNRSISLVSLIAIIFLSACSQPSDPASSSLLGAEFYTFELNMAENAGLLYNATGYQDGNSIILEYPDYSIPGFVWIPRFSTDAVSVEIDGLPQESGISAVNFSSPVTYTLTAASGNLQQFSVELRLQTGWMDMGATPVLPAQFPSSIRTGFLHNLTPFVLCLDNTSALRAYALDLVDGMTWGEFFGGPVNVEQFDALHWNHQIWAVTQTIGGLIESQSCIPPNAWSGTIPVTAVTGSAAGLHVFEGSENRMFAAWIDDSSGIKRPVVWTFDTAAWTDVGGSMSSSPITPFHAESFRAATDGGLSVYAACTFAEAPGLIHLFYYDESLGVWTDKARETGSPSGERDRIIIDMFYDSHKQAPVVFTRSKDNTIENTFKITPLYYNELAGVWTNLDYIDAFYINEADYTSLSISWNENSPSAAFGNSVLNWDGEFWKKIGGDNYGSSPSVQSLTKGVLNTYMTALRDDGTGDLIVRFYQ